MPRGADAEQHASQSEAPIKPNRLVIHTTGNMTQSTNSLNINTLLTLLCHKIQNYIPSHLQGEG